MNIEVEANKNRLLKWKRVTKLRLRDHKVNVVNCCNGFLCLSDPLHNDPVMVCNLITGEFMTLPVPTKSSQKFSDCGLGFCLKTDHYKVVRIFNKDTCELTIEPITGERSLSSKVAEIHTLGTNAWKRVGCAPSSLRNLEFSTYLNGTLNWLYFSNNHSYNIAAFDFDEEKFQSIPIPPENYSQMSFHKKSGISIGALRGCLCLCDSSYHREGINIWVMRTYGVESSWNIELTIDMFTCKGTILDGLYEPLSYFKDGTLLLFHPLSSAIFCYDPEDKSFKFLRVYGIKSKFEAISYNPSFISLKDAMIGEDVEVYDFKSRCGGMLLQGECNAASLVEECADYASDVQYLIW